MIKNICNVWKMNKSELFIMLIVLLACGILGMFLIPILIHVDSETPFIALGSVFATVIWGLINYILGLVGYQNTFDLIVSMGCRRKDFIISQTVAVYLNMLLEFVMIILIYAVENLLHRIVYPTYQMEDITGYILNPKMMGTLFLVIPALRLLMGALILKYKKKAFWIMWAIWVIGSYGSGRIISYLAHHPQNWIMIVISSLSNMEASVQMLLVLLLTVGMLIGTCALIRKQAVYF